MPHLEATLNSLGFDAPGTALRGRRFEHFVQQVFRKHSGAYGRERFKDIWLWNEWPDRERFGYGPDYGIDLVAQQTYAYGGGLCAIQCKYRGRGGSVSTSEVDSFLAAVGRPFDSSLIVTSSSISRKGVEKIRKAVPRCQVLHTAEMDDWVGDWRVYVDSPESFEIPPPEKYELHDFQREALEAVVEGLSVAERGQLILPCGTGKSFLALRIAEWMAGEGGRVLYLVPSIALVGQTMREWSAQRSIPLEYLGVCSDPTAGKKASERLDLAGDLSELAIPVTTDPEKIREQLTTPLAPGVMQVVFSTYHSSPQIESATDGTNAVFDLIICDEAHRTTGVGASASERSYYQIVHYDDHIPAAKRLYMTATPRVFTERAKQKLAELGENEDPDCYDMNDENVYGKELYRMSFGDAIDGGHLSDYEILVITASVEAYLQSMGRAHDLIVGSDREVSIDDAVRLAGCWDALASPETTGVSPGQLPGEVRIDGGFPAKSAIAFTNRVDTSKWVANNWHKIVNAMSKDDHQWPFLGLEVGHVDGTTPASERVRYLRSLEQSADGDEDVSQVCQVVSNARVLSEGVNVPSLDAVLFLDPRSSTIDITQQVGRVMRKSSGKEKGYIVIPVVVPEGEDPKKLLEASDWKMVWQVVKALRSHDERLNHYVNHEAAWKNAPMRFKVSRLGQSERQLEDAQKHRIIQLELALSNEIASMVVEKCGDRNVYPTWGKRAADVCRRIQSRIEELTCKGREFEEAIKNFVEGIKASVRREVTLGEAQQMIAQHIVSIPVFDAMLGRNKFSQRNPVSKDIEQLLDEFKNKGISFEGEVRPLTRAYKGMSEAFEGAVSSSAKLDILRRIYEEFFKVAMADTVKQLGIVYTPMEIVDFMVRSAAAICQKEFGRSISSKDVNVIDPFAGTGTFLARLLEMHDENGEYIIRDADLERKYLGELHANELVLLAYYIAALKIEEAKHARDEERNNGKVEYTPFEKIVWTDTLHGSPDEPQLPGILDKNIKNREEQDKIPIEIIIGNPPWSAGMKTADANNPNIEYDDIAKKIKLTYSKKQREIKGRSAGAKAYGNLYVKAFRWATDRISFTEEKRQHNAVIGFVHPNSLTDGPSLVGVRAMMREEFSDIYVVNLRGNAYKSGEEFRKEGDKIFGGGSRNGVQITFLVRKPDKDLSNPAVLRYAQVPDRMSLEEKFEWLKDLEDITSSELEEVPVTSRHDWVNLSDDSYQGLLAVCDTDKKTEEVAVRSHALGLATNCDTYVYSFNRSALERKMVDLIAAYNETLDILESTSDFVEIERMIRDSSSYAIKWTATLKNSLKQKKRIEFEPWRIREVLYRPFTKLWLYEDDRILSSVRTVSKMFPRDEGVEGFGVTGGSNNSSPDSLIAVEGLADLNSVGPARGGGELSPEWCEGGGGGGNTCYDALQQGALRSPRDAMHRRPLRGRDAAGQSSLPQVGILLTGPSNMATFGVLVSGLLPDLHSLAAGQQTRVIPRM